MFERFRKFRNQQALLAGVLMLTASGCAQLSGSNERVRGIVKAAQSEQDAGNFEGAQTKLGSLKKAPEQLSGSTEEKRKILRDVIKLYTGLARHYQESGDFVAAKRLLQRAIEIECVDQEWLREGGPATESYKRLMSSQSTDKHLSVQKRVGAIEKASDEVAHAIKDAKVLESKKQYARAVTVLRDAEKICAPNSTDKAGVLVAMTNSLHELGKRKEAILGLKEARQIYEDNPQKPAQLVETLFLLANVLETEKRYEEASETLVRALAVADQHPAEVPDKAYLLGRTSVSLIRLKKYPQGEALEARFIKSVREGAIIAESNEFLHHLILGDLYQADKQPKKAILAYKRGLKIWNVKKHSPDTKRTVGYLYSQLANSELVADQLEDAAAHSTAAVDLIDPAVRLGMAGTLNAIAGKLKDRGESKKGVLLNERALHICDETVGRNGLATLSTLIQYADSAKAAGNPEKARWCLKEAILRAKNAGNSEEKNAHVATAKSRMRLYGLTE